MNRVKEARTNAGLKQNELADRLKIGKSTISEWEKQIRDPKSDMLMKIADICGCTVDYLLLNDRYDKEAPLSPEALRIARIYDNSNEKIKAAFEAVAAITEA